MELPRAATPSSRPHGLVHSLLSHHPAAPRRGLPSRPRLTVGYHLGLTPRLGSKIIAQHLHQSGLAMVFLVAHAGGSILLGVTGVIVSQTGVATLQPILVGLLAATIVAWLVVPDPRKMNLI